MTNHLIAAGCCTLLHQLKDCQLSELRVISQKLSPILKECWDFDPKARPTFLQLHAKINALSNVEMEEEPQKTGTHVGAYNKISLVQPFTNPSEQEGSSSLPEVNSQYNIVPESKQEI